MATNNEIPERSTSIDSIKQLEDDIPSSPVGRAFTPEQRRILGEAYRLILSWQPVPTIPAGGNTGQHTIPHLAIVEAEA